MKNKENRTKQIKKERKINDKGEKKREKDCINKRVEK